MLKKIMVTIAFALVAITALADDPIVVTIDAPQTAGISGFRAFWDTPVVLSADGATTMVDKGGFGKAVSAVWAPAKRGDGKTPGALVFDGIHRSLLVRFPGVAKAIIEQQGKGNLITKAELILPFKGTELWPEGYAEPPGMSFLGNQWANSKPRWHAVAWALRKPWVADATNGPTYNAYINGAGYWKKYGAQDEKEDRYPTQFGPAEVSAGDAAPIDGNIDLTSLLSDPAFGKTSAERLSQFESCGVLVRKLEFYDVALWQGSYEWQTARGPQGILINTPKLKLTFTPAKSELKIDKDISVDIAKITEDLKAKKNGGAPTAVIPNAEDFAKLSTKLGFARPKDMPEWQWRHIQELNALGGGWSFPTTINAYEKWLDEMLTWAPRRWGGFDATNNLQLYNKYYEAIPQPIRDHWKLYWSAWLMPDKSYPEFEHNGKKYRFAQGYIGGQQAQAYYKETGDWSGNFSVYRTYCYDMGTMNFNHWAVAGTLLGGKVVGSDRLIKDGRHGLEYWPLRTWSWYDGSTQESIDHYYFSHSLTAQKIFADFGPEKIDRMMGQSIMAKSIEELASSYHPGLRRFVSSSGRTGIAYLLGIQDGLTAIMHTLSPSGTYTDFDKKEVTATNVEKMPVIGHDFQPGLAAQQSMNGPWAPDWMADIIDDKPLPYEMTVNYKQWGNYASTPLWRKTYMGKNYGMASLDVSCGNETVPVMGQWRREEKQAASMTDLGTLIVRPGINRTELLDSIYHDNGQRNPNGCIGTQGSTITTLQHKNKMVVLTSPLPKLEFGGGRPVPAEVKSLQTTIGLFNFQEKPTWELYVDGKQVTEYPCNIKYGQRITIKDGVSYAGIIPITAADLGRDIDVEIVNDGKMTEMQGGGKAREALRINAYIMKSANPLDKTTADWTKIDQAYGGFVVEMSDVAEYKNFADFQKYIADAKLDSAWNAADKTLNVAYASGNDKMECTYKPEYTGGPTDKCFPMRKVNGQWPYLPTGINRDSTCTLQGTTGILQKNGATLTTETGKMGYLLTDPKSGSYIGINPFPDPTIMTLSLPENVSVEADGKLGITRLIIQPKDGKIVVDYAARDDQNTTDMATALIVFGLKAAPKVELNGKVINVIAKVINEKPAFIIPLTALNTDAIKLIPDRYLLANKIAPVKLKL